MSKKRQKTKKPPSEVFLILALGKGENGNPWPAYRTSGGDPSDSDWLYHRYVLVPLKGSK